MRAGTCWAIYWRFSNSLVIYWRFSNSLVFCSQGHAKATKLRLAGNAMDAEVVTSILCYGLSIARKYRTFAFPYCDLPLMQVEFEGEGSDEPMEPPTAARSPGEVAAHPAFVSP